MYIEFHAPISLANTNHKIIERGGSLIIEHSPYYLINFEQFIYICADDNFELWAERDKDDTRTTLRVVPTITELRSQLANK
jgi:hypothetical protein